MKRVLFRYTKGRNKGFETEYKEDVADILEKRGDGVIIERPKAIVVSRKSKENKDPGETKDSTKDEAPKEDKSKK